MPATLPGPGRGLCLPVPRSTTRSRPVPAVWTPSRGKRVPSGHWPTRPPGLAVAVGAPGEGTAPPAGQPVSVRAPGTLSAPPRFSLRRKLFPPVPQVKTELGGSLTPGLQVSTARPCPPPLGFRNQIGRPRGRRGCSARGRGPLCPPGPRASSPQEGTRAGSRGKGTGPRRSAALCAATPRPGSGAV